MIKMRLLSGPFAGRERIFYGETAEGIEPSDLLGDCVRNGYAWEIVWTRATQQEAVVWGGADMFARILRALMEGRSVTFLGTEYRVGEGDTVQDVAQAVEDAIANSGMMVVLERDDQSGVVIGTGGHVQ